MGKHGAIDFSFVFEDLRRLVLVYGPQLHRPIFAPSQNLALILAKHRAIDRTSRDLRHIVLFEGLADKLVLTYDPQPRRSVFAPSQNLALVAVKCRARDRLFVFEGLMGSSTPPQSRRSVFAPSENPLASWSNTAPLTDFWCSKRFGWPPSEQAHSYRLSRAAPCHLRSSQESVLPSPVKHRAHGLLLRFERLHWRFNSSTAAPFHRSPSRNRLPSQRTLRHRPKNRVCRSEWCILTDFPQRAFPSRQVESDSLR